VEEETEETDTRTTPTRGGTSALALPPPPPAPPTPDESLFTGWRRSFVRLGPIGHASRLSVVPDGPGKYVFKVQSTGSCVGQTSEGIVTLYVDCNLAPVPDASVSYRPDNLLDLELGGRYAAPPPAPPPLPPPPPELPPLPPPLVAGFVDPGESTAAPPAPVTVYEPIEPYPATKNLASVPRCFDKGYSRRRTFNRPERKPRVHRRRRGRGHVHVHVDPHALPGAVGADTWNLRGSARELFANRHGRDASARSRG
jgi:hypothetical protein